jgi:hypothetical protein
MLTCSSLLCPEFATSTATVTSLKTPSRFSIPEVRFASSKTCRSQQAQKNERHRWQWWCKVGTARDIHWLAPQVYHELQALGINVTGRLCNQHVEKVTFSSDQQPWEV